MALVSRRVHRHFSRYHVVHVSETHFISHVDASQRKRTEASHFLLDLPCRYVSPFDWGGRGIQDQSKGKDSGIAMHFFRPVESLWYCLVIAMQQVRKNHSELQITLLNGSHTGSASALPFPKEWLALFGAA